MDMEKATKVTDLVKKHSFISMLLKEYQAGLHEMGESLEATTTVHIYSRWLPLLIEKAADELDDLTKQIREL